MRVELFGYLSLTMLLLGILLAIGTFVFYKKMDIATAFYAVTRKKIKHRFPQKLKSVSKQQETMCLDTLLLQDNMMLLQNIIYIDSSVEKESITEVISSNLP